MDEQDWKTHSAELEERLAAFVAERTAHLAEANLRLQQEINERVRTEESLRYREKQLADFLDSTSEGFFALDRDWRFLYLNKQHAIFAHHKPEELVGKVFWEVFPAYLGTPAEQSYRQAMHERIPIHFETRGFYNPNWFEITINPAPNGLSVFTRDVSEKHRMEEALRLSEEKFSAAFANTPAAMILTRLADGLIVDVNKTWEALLGYSRNEVIGQSARLLPFWPSAEHTIRFVQTLRDQGAIQDWEQVFHHRSGRPINVRLSAQVITVQGEQVILTIMVDISRRKQAEKALQEANELLEKRVEERTRELKTAEEELRQRNEELEQALVKEKELRIQLIQAEKNAALARLIASIAHEINNPLQTVKNSLYLLRMDLGSPDTPDVLDMAYAESQRMGNLVQQLRETYRPSELKEVDFDLGDVLHKVQRLLEPQFHQNHVEWSMENHLERIPLHGIPDRIQQVFLNICLNAVDAMGSAGGLLRVRITQACQTVRISFQDSGPGISPENMEQLFEPFFTTKVKGTGLGLVISYEIIKDHHGEICVESAPGQGATFTVSLPMKVA